MEATLIRDETHAFLPGSNYGSKGEMLGECALATQETRNYTVQDAGYIAGFSDWTPDDALALANNEGMCLGEQHWLIIHFMRGYYSKHRSCPMLKLILKNVNQMAGGQALDVRGMFKLFGSTPVRTAARYAGLPEPDSCT